ncbi:MAG: hypothetical protein QM726_12755 [Chitinophagaceae bacterium]
MKKITVIKKSFSLLLLLTMFSTALMANETSVATHEAEQSGLQTIIGFTVLLLFILLPLFRKRRSGIGSQAQ